MSPEKVAFGERQAAAIERIRDQDPEALAQAAMAQQQATLSPAREAAIAHQRERQAGLKALYERQIAERPSDLRVVLDRMAQNIHQPGGYGASMLGVSPALQAARQGYTTQEIGQLNTLSDLDAAIDTAIQNNNLSDYNTYVARKKDIETQAQKALEYGTTMADVNEKVTAGLQRNYETVEGRKQTAATLAQQRADAANQANERIRELAKDRLMQLQIARAGAGDRAADAAQLRRDALAQKARTDAIKYAEKLPNFAYLEPEQQEAAIRKYTDMILNQSKAPAAPGGGDIASLAAQELARRQGQRKTLTGAR
jgi:hypothetical protein